MRANPREIAGLIVTVLAVTLVIGSVVAAWVFAGTTGVLVLGVFYLAYRVAIGGK